MSVTPLKPKQKELPPLDERIAAALADDVPSAVISGLIPEVEHAIEVAKAAFDIAKAKALSPKTLLPEVQAARRQMQDAEFLQERMQRAETELQGALQAALRAEQSLAARAGYEAALIERDAVAKELVEYPALAQQLAGILHRLRSSNEQMRAASRAMEAASEGIEDGRRAEDIARPRELRVGNRDSILDLVVLPDFERGEPHLWPERDREHEHEYLRRSTASPAFIGLLASRA